MAGQAPLPEGHRPLWRAKVYDAIGVERASHWADDTATLQRALQECATDLMPKGWWVIIKKDSAE